MRQQPLLGFSLALIAAVMWSSLPIALQQLVSVMDAKNIVWFRFVVAAVGLFFLLLFSKKLPPRAHFNSRYIRFVIIGIVGLAANFYLYNYSLKFIPATASQVISPLSSFAMLLSGIVLFKERIRLHQKVGLALLLIGLSLFFNDRFADFVAMNQFSFGILLGVSAALIWVGYGLAQKMLLERFSSQQILLVLYWGCSLIFMPFADLSPLKNLTPLMIGSLIFCCLNTLIAYGCYAEALNRWDVSKVSMVMPMIPILTIIFTKLAHYIAPDIFPASELNWISYLGALFVVLGALSAAAGHKLFNKRLR